ncbi:hypothetical protein LRP88_11844 [Fusarium phalaenopsidis]|nr:hypothetical protein NCS56_01258700 [Fusarium sp. Ph1]
MEPLINLTESSQTHLLTTENVRFIGEDDREARLFCWVLDNVKVVEYEASSFADTLSDEMLVLCGSEKSPSRHSNSQFWLEDENLATGEEPHDDNADVHQEILDYLCEASKRIWTVEELQEGEFLTPYDYEELFYEVVEKNAWTLVWE